MIKLRSPLRPVRPPPIGALLFLALCCIATPLAADAPVTPETRRQRSADIVVTLKEYRSSLEKSLGVYESGLAKATEQRNQRRNFYDRGIIGLREVEEAERAVTETQAKVDGTRQEIAAADHAIAEANVAAHSKIPTANPRAESMASKLAQAKEASKEGLNRYRASLAPVLAMYERELERQTELAQIRQSLYENGTLPASDLLAGRRSLLEAQKHVDDIRRQVAEVDRMMKEIIDVGEAEPRRPQGSVSMEGAVQQPPAPRAKSLPEIASPPTSSLKSATPSAPRTPEAPSRDWGTFLVFVGIVGGVSWLVARPLLKRARSKVCACGRRTPSPSGVCERCQDRGKEADEARRRAEEAQRAHERRRQEEESRRRSESGGDYKRKQSAAGPQSPTFDPYSVLGVAKGASQPEIRKAYLTLLAKYHPDKVAHLGLEFQEIAKEKTQAITRAYQILGRMRS